MNKTNNNLVIYCWITRDSQTGRVKASGCSDPVPYAKALRLYRQKEQEMDKDNTRFYHWLEEFATETYPFGRYCAFTGLAPLAMI